MRDGEGKRGDLVGEAIVEGGPASTAKRRNTHSSCMYTYIFLKTMYSIYTQGKFAVVECVQTYFVSNADRFTVVNPTSKEEAWRRGDGGERGETERERKRK